LPPLHFLASQVDAVESFVIKKILPNITRIVNNFLSSEKPCYRAEKPGTLSEECPSWIQTYKK
ncbi:MAG TPA: hypothetical protein VEI46_10210, partial [Thermodesulfovibrionales bacterium]|nr:hypothetical protein [Thermodesulfovibrionales bacterium]